jgi:hypothetical protein
VTARWAAPRLPRMRRDMAQATRSAQGFTDADVTRDVNRLLAADLYWVTADMTRLALNASADLPEWTPAAAMPSRFGMLVWDGGLPTLPWTGAPERGYRLGPFGDPRPPDVAVAGVAWAPDEKGVMLSPLARTGPLGDLLTPRWAACELFPFGAVILPSMEPLTVEDLEGNAAGLVATLGATWLLMMQPTVADTRPLDMGRGSGGPGAGGTRPDREVRIIDLRRAVSPPREPGPGDDGRVYRHRWIVGGHWRQQAVGAGRTQRRPTYIASHVKGPEGAPMLETERVNVWRR